MTTIILNEFEILYFASSEDCSVVTLLVATKGRYGTGNKTSPCEELVMESDGGLVRP